MLLEWFVFDVSLYKWALFITFVALAGVAQLVERDLPKVDVEGSRPFSRSQNKRPRFCLGLLF